MKKVVILSALMLALWGCDAKKDSVPAKTDAAEGEELYCLTDSKEEAEEIADMYQIELVRYGDGVAVFHTQEDPRSVIEKGKANGFPKLAINHSKYSPQ